MVKKKKRRQNRNNTTSKKVCASESINFQEKPVPLCRIDNRDVIYAFHNEIERRKDLIQTKLKQGQFIFDAYK